MDSPRSRSLADALAHLSDADDLFVRLALSRDEAVGMTLRSLVVDVLPTAWLTNHDESLLYPWLHDQPPSFRSRDAVFFTGLLESKIVRGWFERPQDCGLTGLDSRPGFATLRVPFTFPEVHDTVTEWRLPSYSEHGAKPIPYPNTLYSLTPKQPRYGTSWDDDRLVSDDGDTIPSFRLERAARMFGVMDRNQAYQRDDVLAIRVVDARGWLKEVRVTPTMLVATLGGTALHRGCRLVVQGPGVNEQTPVAGRHVSIPLPARINHEVEVVLVGEGTVLDRTWFYGIDHPYPYFSRHPQVLVEREDVVGYAPPPRVGSSEFAPTDVQAEVLAGEDSGHARPKVFVSYSHDSTDHMQTVFDLATRLRQDGIDCQLDQYVQNPPEGWPRWMMRKVDWADFVLVVCTETYCQRFNAQQQPGKGLGAAWEGQLITQTIFEHAGNNDKFIPIVFSPEDEKHIPMPLRPATHYKVADETQYQELYARLTRQTLTAVPPLGEIRKVEPRVAGIPTLPAVESQAQHELFGAEAQRVLRHLARSVSPEDTVTLEALAQALGLQVDQNLIDALHELGDAGAIKGYGNNAHRYKVFQVTPRTWEYVDTTSAGFDVEKDMVTVAMIASQHEQIDREILLSATGLPAKRLDIAALLLRDHGDLTLYQPIVRGLTFATAIADHKTREFVRRHKA